MCSWPGCCGPRPIRQSGDEHDLAMGGERDEEASSSPLPAMSGDERVLPSGAHRATD